MDMNLCEYVADRTCVAVSTYGEYIGVEYNFDTFCVTGIYYNGFDLCCDFYYDDAQFVLWF